MIYELVLRNFNCSLEFVFSLLLIQPFNFSPVSLACNLQDWGCVILREIDFLFKNLLIDSLLTRIVESTYLNRHMCKFESSQKDESRWQLIDSSKAYRNTSAFKFYHGLVSCYRRRINKFSKMEVRWWTYNHCLFVSYLTSVPFEYGWISDTKFQKFSDKDWI